MKSIAVNLHWICVLIGWATAVPATSHALEIPSSQTRWNPNGVTVTFSEPVSKASATEPSHYTIDNGELALPTG